MNDTSIVDWVADSSLVDGVFFGAADGGESATPVCAVAVVGGIRGFGKGLTKGAALCSAIGEALEQYAARRVPHNSLIRAPYREIMAQAFDPRWLCLYSEQQYACAGFPYRRFDPERPTLWTPGHWVDTGDPVWLPASAVYLSADLEAEEALCQVTSNGLAAGISAEEAACHATLELYERSEFVGAWLTRQPGKRYAMDNLQAEYASVVEHARSRGADIEIYLFSSSPFVAACVARGDGRSWPGVTLGLGAGSNEHEAVGKAILEHGQTGPYLARIWRNRERPIPALPEEIKSLQDHALYYCDPSHASEFDFLRGGSGALPHAQTQVRVAIANLTPADLQDSPFRVVRALAVGLQPIHYGHGLERVLGPHLKASLAGRPPNTAPIPIC